MAESEPRNLEAEDTAVMKTVKGAAMGAAAGTVWGTIVATLYDTPHVETNAKLPEIMRTLKVSGTYGLTFAAIGGTYIGVQQLLEKQRMKRDFVNGAVGAFVAGASILGLKGRSISAAVISGSALAVASAVLDLGGLIDDSGK